MIRNIVFDCGGVIADVKYMDLLRKYKPNPIEMARLAVILADGKEWSDWNKGLMTLDEMADMLSERYPKYRDMLSRALKDDFLGYLEIDEGMRKTVASLKKSGYGIYLLADIPMEFHKVFMQDEIYKFIDGGVFSYEEHVRKPDKSMYEKLCAKYKLVPGECLFVDDNKKYLEPAKAMGMQVVLFSKPQAAIKEIARKLEESNG